MNKYQFIKNGRIKELNEGNYNSLIYSFLLSEIDFAENVERHFENGVCTTIYSLMLADD